VFYGNSAENNNIKTYYLLDGKFNFLFIDTLLFRKNKFLKSKMITLEN
jgi:hypothetical protein